MNTLNERIIQIQDTYPDLSNTMQRIHRFVFDHLFEICYLSLKELSQQAQVSEVTVLSFCHQIGFDSFNEFRDFFRAFVGFSLQNNPFVIRPSASITSVRADEDAVRKFMWLQYNNYTKTVLNADFAGARKAARIIHQSEQVYVMGHDASKISADYFSHRLKLLRLKAWSLQLGAAESVQAILANLNQNDTAIIISMQPYFKPSKDIVKYIEMRGASIIVITDSFESPAVGKKSIPLLCKTKAPLIFNTMSSTMALMELLTSMIAVEMGDRYEQVVHEFLAINMFISGNSEKGQSS